MERFAQLVVGGGLGLVAGLWFLALFESGSIRWAVGVGLVAFGVCGLAGGIWLEVEF